MRDRNVATSLNMQESHGKSKRLIVELWKKKLPGVTVNMSTIMTIKVIILMEKSSSLKKLSMIITAMRPYQEDLNWNLVIKAIHLC